MHPSLSLFRATILAGALTGSLADPAVSHEFWIALETHQAEPGAVVRGDLRVGQMLKGESYPYLSDQIIAVELHGPNEDIEIDGMEGDLPALTVTLTEPGLHVITYYAAPNYIVFEDIPSFREYLTYEGLDEVIGRHIDRGLPTSDIAEEYIRNARTLLQVGPADPEDIDQPTGMPFELVTLQNPYVEGTSEIEVQLLWQGEPMPDRQVSVFRTPGASVPAAQAVRSLLTTNARGRAVVPIGEGGFYLLNAVHMEPVAGPGSVVWQSHWASLTFTAEMAPETEN